MTWVTGLVGEPELLCPNYRHYRFFMLIKLTFADFLGFIFIQIFFLYIYLMGRKLNNIIFTSFFMKINNNHARG
jgi:hypothetical protein